VVQVWKSPSGHFVGGLLGPNQQQWGSNDNANGGASSSVVWAVEARFVFVRGAETITGSHFVRPNQSAFV